MSHKPHLVRRTGMDVLVLGATGVAGRSVVRTLAEAGHRVRAHARTPEKADLVRSLGATAALGDAEDRGTLVAWMDGVDAVVDLRVAIPSGGRAMLPWAWREYARLRGVETGRVVACALTAGVPVVVHDTVSMVYDDGGDALLHEDAPVRAPGALAANLAAERHLTGFTRAGGRGVALRFGQFYGPDDAISLDLLRRARNGQALVLGDPSGWTSSIHTADVGPAVLAALDVPAGVYNVVDDEPMRRRDWVDLLATSVGRASLKRPPGFVTAVASAPLKALARSQRVSAERFRDAGGWRPTVPSRRVGWPEVAHRTEEASR